MGKMAETLEGLEEGSSATGQRSRKVDEQARLHSCWWRGSDDLMSWYTLMLQPSPYKDSTNARFSLIPLQYFFFWCSVELVEP